MAQRLDLPNGIWQQLMFAGWDTVMRHPVSSRILPNGHDAQATRVDPSETSRRPNPSPVPRWIQLSFFVDSHV